MELEIKAIIEKNLPAHVGEVLRTKLEQADKDAKRVTILENELKQEKSQVEFLQKEIRTYKAFDERNASLDNREKEVESKERELKINTLEYQLNAEKDKTKFSQDVALGFVRNSEYRRTLFDNVSEPYRDQYGNTQYQSKSQNSEETKTVK